LDDHKRSRRSFQSRATSAVVVAEGSRCARGSSGLVVVEFDNPSYEELKELVAAQQLVIEQQSERIAELEARIVELERRRGTYAAQLLDAALDRGTVQTTRQPRRAPSAEETAPG
jgi:hypothetical protein